MLLLAMANYLGFIYCGVYFTVLIDLITFPSIPHIMVLFSMISVTPLAMYLL